MLSFRSFLVYFLIAVGALAALSGWLLSRLHPPAVLPALLGLGLVAMLTLWAYSRSQQALQAAPGKFVTAVLGSMGIKMLGCLGAVIAVGVWNADMVKAFTIVLMGSYFVLTAFEVWALLRNLRALSK